ncbi:MAG: acetate kinase [Clostridia bacterium]|nr:acetate kinase [Clostridia bacterium]
MKILVINAGSSSLKYQLFDMTDETVIAKGNCERIGIDGFIKGKTFRGEQFKVEIDMPTHTDAFNVVKNYLTEGEYKVIDSMDEIAAVGHRVVQGGALFDKSCLITDEVVDGIESLIDLAPLHNAAHLQGIRACQNVLGKDVPEVAVFDNAFHLTMPPESYLFPIPYEYYEKYKVRRYGFHGTSHRYVTLRYAELNGIKDMTGTKIITCHLGNGASISAIKDGKCFDTSMGLTPLDGFMMGSRSGTLDPSVVTYIAEKENLSPKDLSNIFNKKSGLLGISGVSSDDRDVTEAAENGNERAALARRMQWYQIRKFIGSYVAAMDGVDAIVFTGGLGENGQDVREGISTHLNYLGITLDKEVNETMRFGKEGIISTPDSKIPLWVIPTDEERMIARDTKSIVESL